MTKEIWLDTRELEAPQPLVLALRSLENLQENEVLVFHHRTSPTLLFGELQARGFVYEIIKDAPNEFMMKIFRS